MHLEGKCKCIFLLPLLSVIKALPKKKSIPCLFLIQWCLLAFAETLIWLVAFFGTTHTRCWVHKCMIHFRILGQQLHLSVAHWGLGDSEKVLLAYQWDMWLENYLWIYSWCQRPPHCAFHSEEVTAPWETAGIRWSCIWTPICHLIYLPVTGTELKENQKMTNCFWF